MVKKKNVSEIERGVGYFMGLTTSLMDIVRGRAIPFEAIYRLVKPGGRNTLEKMVELARADWEAEQPKPSGDQCHRVHVSYAKLPVMEELEKRFSVKDSVSSLFDGRPWERHSSCAKIDETPGEREFFVASVPKQFFSQRIDTIRDALAAHFGGLGYRFAIETEAVTFAAAQPGLPHQNWIYALGSSALSFDDDQYVALLLALDRGRVLRDRWLGGDLDSDDRLLLVRKCL